MARRGSDLNCEEATPNRINFMKTKPYAAALIFAAIGCAGCRTLETSHRQTATQEMATGTAGLAAAPSPQRQRLESVVRVVLDAHNFVPPVFIDGPDSIRWAVSTRPPTQSEAVLALVEMTSKDEIEIELVPYAHVGSTWALLGREFRGLTDEEAREMDKQIRERLAP